MTPSEIVLACLAKCYPSWSMVYQIARETGLNDGMVSGVLWNLAVNTGEVEVKAGSIPRLYRLKLAEESTAVYDYWPVRDKTA